MHIFNAVCMCVPIPVSSLLFLLATSNTFDIKIILLHGSVLFVILVPTCQTVVGFEIICEFLFEKDL